MLDFLKQYELFCSFKGSVLETLEQKGYEDPKTTWSGEDFRGRRAFVSDLLGIEEPFLVQSKNHPPTWFALRPSTVTGTGLGELYRLRDLEGGDR